MDEKALDALRNGLEDSYWYSDYDEKVFNELVKKAEAFDLLYAEFDKGDKDLSKADFDEVYKGDRCSCTYAVDPIPMLRNAVTRDGTCLSNKEVLGAIKNNDRHRNYYSHIKCPDCNNSNFELEYVKDGIIKSCPKCNKVMDNMKIKSKMEDK